MEVGVIGTGMMGRNHVRVYSELKSVTGLYLYDVNQQAAMSVGLQNGAIPCATIEDLLKKVDALSICVPTQYHLETARQALETGVAYPHRKADLPVGQRGRTGHGIDREDPDCRSRSDRAVQPHRAGDKEDLQETIIRGV